MNRVDPRTNGMPVWADDLDFQHEAIKEALRGAVSDWYNRNCVLKGCRLTRQNTTDFHITEGWVYIDGEILYVPEETVKGNDGGGSGVYDASNWFDSSNHFLSGQQNDHSNNFAFEIEDTWDGSGDKKFHDQVFRNTYRVRRARARYQEVAGPSPGDADYLSIAGRTVEELKLYDLHIQDFIDYNVNDWDLVVFAAWSRKYDPDQPYILKHNVHGYTYDLAASLKNGHGDVGNPYRNLRVVQSHGVAYFVGVLDDTGTSDIFATLPGSLQPNGEIDFYVPDTNRDLRRIKIETNGDCRIDTAGTGYNVPLEGIKYLIDAPQ